MLVIPLLIGSQFFTPTYQAVSQTMVSHHQCLKSKEVLDKEILRRHTSSYSLLTVNKPMKILGIYFPYNSRLKNELNLDATLKSLKKTLKILELHQDLIRSSGVNYRENKFQEFS